MNDTAAPLLKKIFDVVNAEMCRKFSNEKFVVESQRLALTLRNVLTAVVYTESLPLYLQDTKLNDDPNAKINCDSLSCMKTWHRKQASLMLMNTKESHNKTNTAPFSVGSNSPVCDSTSLNTGVASDCKVGFSMHAGSNSYSKLCVSAHQDTKVHAVNGCSFHPIDNFNHDNDGMLYYTCNNKVYMVAF